jgi:hypothetical protein
MRPVPDPGLGPSVKPGLGDYSRLVELLEVRENQTGFRIFLDRLYLVFQLPRIPGIIGIQEGYELPARALDAQVSSSHYTFVILIDIADLILKAGQNGLSIISRAIIHDDDLMMSVGLFHYACNGLEDILLTVERRNDYAN